MPISLILGFFGSEFLQFLASFSVADPGGGIEGAMAPPGPAEQ